jgi:hypothetical protein
LDDGGDIASASHISVGDIRLLAMYSGISEDMSTGVQFGLKLPTGAFHESLLDRDTQIGSGTTDLLLGGYQMGQGNGWGWYGQLMWQHALNTRDAYRPGGSFDVSVGIHYDGFVKTLPIVPTLQLANSFRAIDSGGNADPPNTGFERVYLTPGVEVIATNHFTIFADLRIPIITHVRGFQLVAPALINLTMNYDV